MNSGSEKKRDLLRRVVQNENTQKYSLVDYLIWLAPEHHGMSEETLVSFMNIYQLYLG